MTTRVPRSMVLFSVGAISLAVVIAARVVRQGTSRGGLEPGRCDVSATVSATTEPADRPRAVLRLPSLTWALVTAPAPGHADGAVRVRAIRVADEGAAEVACTVDAPSAQAVSNLVRTPSGAAFAVARGNAVTAWTLRATGSCVERAFPRADGPPGRGDLTPTLALASDGDALTAVARWPSPWGARRLSTRDVRESPPLTPARRDAFHSPDLVVLGDVVLLAQQHDHGGFATDTAPASHVEVVAMDPTPAHPDVLATVVLPRELTAASQPRIARFDAPTAASGALVSWRDAGGITAARVAKVDRGPWQAWQTMRVHDAAPTGPHDVASLAGACGAVSAWREAEGVALRAFDLLHGRGGAVARLPWAATQGRDRVRLERAGDRTVLAVDGAQGVRAWDVVADADCALTLTPVALPTPATSAEARLAGAAASPTRVVLAVTRDAPDAAQTSAVFVTLPSGAGAPVTLSPPAATLPQGVSEMTMFAGDVPVVVGRARGSVMLLRVGDPSEDGEPGEDLLLRAMRGEELAVDASAERHRVWVADVSGDEETGFGPPRAVVVHSAIDTLEDGARTEVRPAEVPAADFARVTLDALEGDARWGVTWSGSAEAPGGAACVPGAWAARYDRDDRAVGTGAWRWMVPLLGDGERACGDRVHAARWRGATLAATVTGERVGARLVVGDLPSGQVRAIALDARAGAHPKLPAVTHAGAGLLAAWLDGDARTPSLRVRMFTRGGDATTGVLTLGEVAEAPVDTQPDDVLPLDGEGTRFAALLRTSHGTRVARIDCGVSGSP